MNRAYTYKIGWTQLGKFYYGVRWANTTSPEDDLWTHYFTSSKVVHEYTKLYGDPDLVQIDQTFRNKEDAQAAETQFLTDNKCTETTQWLNQTCYPQFPDNLGRELSDQHKAKISKALVGRKITSRKPRRLSEDHKRKISMRHQGKSLSDTTKRKISQAKRGTPLSPSHKQKLSDAKKNAPIESCPHCGKQGRGGVMKRWHFENCSRQ